MPTIDIQLDDFEALLEQPVDESALAVLLAGVKGNIKIYDRKNNAAKIELNDSNRPDLWSAEGIARQIRCRNHPPRYTCFSRTASHTIEVSKDLLTVRPYLAACIARGVKITQTVLIQLIQTQEKLAEGFGQQRQTASIGFYRLHAMTFPIRYLLADPDTTRFVPLGYDQSMSLSEILHHHPKGIAYAHTLKSIDRYPILVDAEHQILSFPPIINSRAVGEVAPGDDALLVEVTGTDLERVMLILNILACNLADRHAEIEPVDTRYSYETPWGATVTAPRNFSKQMSVDLSLFRILGEEISAQEAALWLTRYGYEVQCDETALILTAPPYRDDLMHPVDVVEDFAISRGYNTFTPEMPKTFTCGGIDVLERLQDSLREALIGFGFQEILSNMLASRQEMINRMNIEHTPLPERDILEITNPMTDRFSVLRSWILPFLLRVESASAKTFYPHCIFEIGEVAAGATPYSGEITIHLAVLMAHPTANFSELQSVLEGVLRRFGYTRHLEAISHPSFIEGRVGAITLPPNPKPLGVIGEIHPEVLTRWQIGMPAVAFEIEVSPLLARPAKSA